MSVREDRKVHAAESIYIDPLDADSTVSYKIITDPDCDWEGMCGTVHLTDCTRKIEWRFSSVNPNSLAKVDNAIKALQGFRKSFAAALIVDKRSKDAKKRGKDAIR